MSHYTVRVPIVGYMEVYVEANSEDDAVEKAMEMDGTETDSELFWESVRHVTQGNVFYGSLNDLEIDKEDDDED